MTTKIILPEMGEGVIEGTLARWLVKEGDRVEQFAPLAEIETDKVTTEITSEVAGTILKLLVDEGETIPVDTVLAYVSQGDDKFAPGEQGDLSKASTNGQSQAPAQQEMNINVDQDHKRSSSYTGRISPLVGRIAQENDVELGLVIGTGRDGRITKDDILSYIESRDQERQVEITTPSVQLEPESQVIEQPAKGSAEIKKPIPMPEAPSVVGELIPMTAMRRSIADHMVLSKQTSPHVTTVFEIDFSAVAAHREANKGKFARDGAKLTFTVYMITAVVEALKKHPLANSVWTDEGIVLKREINVGMAAAVPGGLTVPVIKGADGLNLLGLARVINDLTERARNKKLSMEELQDGTFSITNHGTSGSLLATPIINQPQAGILGFGKIEKRVKVIKDAIAIRPLAYASFTFDHRILDGATADAFVSSVKDFIENWN